MTSRYAARYRDPQGAGDKRPTALEIVKDNGLENALSDKTILITGCSSGIGIDTAKALAATGATLYCTARDVQKGQKALSNILSPFRVEIIELKLDSLKSVRACAKHVLSEEKKLNVLVCNAGIMAVPELQKTEDGFESQLGTNHLGHFLLFNLLKPALLAGSTPAFNSRVVMVSSTGHRNNGIFFDDMQFENGSYTPFSAYGQSKTANIYMANEIENRYGAMGLHGLSLMPGGIATGLQAHLDPKMTSAWAQNKEVMNSLMSTEQGAATTVLAAVGKDLEGKGRIYLEKCDQAEVVKPGYGMLDGGYKEHAFDKESEGRMWKESLKPVGLAEDD
ncbi:NAD(P)-binding protein [Saccharata proteae CBS 121410]|uniref:NAD(P)-binding protein n=1 Tax=Saccharata proteae CBS 121410 TaxID=1314787 RepID=A0A9P4LRQ6_9PEZI|nr:NAD(P)-binding protein [Saccharata proteae CBS 121410]